MNTSQARKIGTQLFDLVAAGKAAAAYNLLAPVLQQRVKFDMLRLIGKPIGAYPFEISDEIMELVACGKTIGGWVVISSILEGQLVSDHPGVFIRCCKYIIVGDAWCASDSLAEGVTGKALVGNFFPSLELLYPWRELDNRWVRRAVGVSVHYWAKRSGGAPERQDEARELLMLMEPLFGEHDIDAVKGIGWGLKTMGRVYPRLLAAWLDEQAARGNKPHRTIVMRKAQTYLNNLGWGDGASG